MDIVPLSESERTKEDDEGAADRDPGGEGEGGNRDEVDVQSSDPAGAPRGGGRRRRVRPPRAAEVRPSYTEPPSIESGDLEEGYSEEDDGDTKDTDFVSGEGTPEKSYNPDDSASSSHASAVLSSPPMTQAPDKGDDFEL